MACRSRPSPSRRSLPAHTPTCTDAATGRRGFSSRTDNWRLPRSIAPALPLPRAWILPPCGACRPRRRRAWLQLWELMISMSDAAALPDGFASIAELEEYLSQPTPALTSDLAEVEGDILVL